MSKYELVNVLERASIEDYLNLFQMSYSNSDKLTSQYLRWLYIENPHGTADGFDAYYAGDLVAHYVTIPRMYQMGSTRSLGLLSVNTATHPDHQRRGLFSQLAAATYERAAYEGYQFIVGVANAQSIDGFLNKLEFEHRGQIGLALWREPPPVPFGYAQLDKNKDWLSWRLANPSAEYFMTEAGANEAIVNSRKDRAVFSIGRVNRNWVSEELGVEWRRFRGAATLTPVYPVEGLGPFLPRRFMPSPWHVIFRQLRTGSHFISRVHFDGLSMDTF